MTLTNAEWSVMECLWERAPQTVVQLAHALRERAGWAKSTSSTMVTRMAAKGLLTVDESGRARRYAPAIDRAEAVRDQTEHFLDRVYQGSVSLLLNTMVRDGGLSSEELAELHAILDRAEQEGGGAQ